MIRFFARFWARFKYAWEQETEAGRNDLNASLAAKNAEEKRALVKELHRQAEEMDKRITDFNDMEEKGYWECENGHERRNECPCDGYKGGAVVHVFGCALQITDPLRDPKCFECGKQMNFIKRSAMSGQEKYESDKDRRDAETIAKSKREQAKAEQENVEGSEKAMTYFRGLAQKNRDLADKIRSI